MDGHPPDDRYPALAVQRGMILGTLRHPDGGVDIQQVTIDWDGPLDRAAFVATWRAAIRRHPALRTSFRTHGDDGLVQVVAPATDLDLRFRDPAPDPAGGFLRADRFEPFDVGRAPLFRVTAWADAGRAGHRVVLTFHHAIMDGRSMRLLLDEVFAGYAARRAGREPDHPDRRPFADFVHWWGAVDLGAAGEFWKGRLAGAAVPRPLPGYLGDGVGERAEPATGETGLTRADSDHVRALGAELGVGASAVVNAAWALLRGAYGGVDDVTFAVTRSCRYGSVPGADDMIGMLITTVPLRLRLDPKWTVRHLVADVGRRMREVRDHQLAPLASILDGSGLPAETPLLDSLVIFERQRLHTALAALGPEPARRSVRVHRLPGYPLTLYAFDEPRMRLAAMWDGRRMLDASARHLLARLLDTVRELAHRPDARLADLDLGTGAEAGLRAGWNATRRPYPRGASVPDLFAARVAEHPEGVALIAVGTTVSYAELDRDTDRLARALHRCGVAPDTPVAVAVPRGAALIRVLLAVLKAGGAYLPLDLASPPARIAAVLAGAGVRLVLTTAEVAGRLPASAAIRVLDVDELAAEPAPPGPPPARIHPLNLAYVSYTSGSTGVPKGVAVPHRAVARLVAAPDFARLGPGERVLHLAPAAFDASTLEIWGALLTGATVVVAPPDPLDLTDLAALLRTAGVTVAWLTAGLFHQLVEVDPAALAGVGQLLTGGDVVSPSAVRAALAVRGGRPLVNGYGPTENTTFTTCHVMTGPDGVGERVPIGRPVQQTTVHVLDADSRPVPVGVAGELYTGGDGLARGYLGDAGATARSFVPDPDGHGARLYRTGDLARWRADGVLEFLGRLDEQVKVRGFRVEPGEVAAVLAGHPGVAAAAVRVAGDGPDRHLVGYVTPADGIDRATLTPATLREYASGRLPGYLVPAGFAVLDRLPLTANGKVDRAALPPPDRERAADDPELAGPASPTERRLAEVWSRLLPGDPAIARDLSFFTLGGNSLTAARLMFRVRETFGVELGLGGFYQAPTLAATAAVIDSARGTAGSPDAGPAGRPAIRRRDRDAHRVARDPQLPGHLIRLTGGWALWRTVCLRAAGFPVDLLESLGDAVLAGAADRLNAAGATRPGPPGSGGIAEAGAMLGGGDGGARVADITERIAAAEAAYAAEFPRAVRRLGDALRAAATRPAFREAVTWQNPHALATGIDALLRHEPGDTARNTKHRQHETLVASYLQRYCAKNDTIGFFGPVGWARFAPGGGVRVDHADPPALLAARTVYLEGWAVAAVMAPHAAALRPWLVPRRMPFLDVSGAILRVPLAPPITLTAAEAAVLRACDGIREAREVADAVLAVPESGLATVAQVYGVLDALCEAHRLAWRPEVAPHDTRPEESMRERVARVTDETVRGPALTALDELCAARDALARAAVDPLRLAGAMAGLGETFTRLAGVAPSRRPGALYAGRTPVYEECLRAGDVTFGEASLDGIRESLGLVLESARWFTAGGAALYRRLFDEIYRRRAAELGTGVVPFTDFWLRAGELVFDPPDRLTAPLVRALQERWAGVLSLPPDRRRVRLAASRLAPAVAGAFPPGKPGWPAAVQHSPDLMIATDPAGGTGWVLGELHPGVNTLRYATWVAHHPSPADLRAAIATDLGRGVVYAAETGEEGGIPTRQSNAFVGPHDIRLVFAHDSFGHDPARSLPVGECDLVEGATGLRVRRRDGRIDLDVIEVFGDLIGAALAQRFRMLAPEEHTPRVTIDDLVVSRESWTFPAADLAFAGTTDEARRFREARAWATGLDLPRHVFLRCAGERKPVYADLTSLASVDLAARSVRRARRHSGDAAPVTVTEMLPAPDQLWLTDAGGSRYSAELRIVAVDGRVG